MNKKADNISSNFGKQGWIIILFTGVMFYISTATNVDGLNITIPAIAEANSWEVSQILGFSTICGLISVVGTFIMGNFCAKKGARITSVLSLALCGLSYMWYGNTKSIAGYAISLSILMIFANVSAHIAGGAYLSSWFPRKKGLAMGWSTMGSNFASATIVIILTYLCNTWNIRIATIIVGVVILLVAVWGIFVKDRPEDANCTPDNVEMSQDEIDEYRRQSNTYVSKWTTKDLLKTKEVYLICIPLGSFMLVTVGIMSQLVPRLIGSGYFTQNQAVSAMTVCALIGVVGSYLWGVIDQLLTTKKACFLFGIWYAVGIVFNLIPNFYCSLISLFIFGIAIGGNANFPVSLTTSVFGHRDFSKAYSVINPLMSIIRVLAFVVLAISLSLTKSYTAAYIAFIVISLLGSAMVQLIDDSKYNPDAI